MGRAYNTSVKYVSARDHIVWYSLFRSCFPPLLSNQQTFQQMASCTLYQNSDPTIVIDIPRSIELAQGASSLRLLSSKPIEHPWPSLQPRTSKAKENFGPASLPELLLERHLVFALESVAKGWKGEWCLPRLVADEADGKADTLALKRKKEDEAPLSDEISTIAEINNTSKVFESAESLFYSNNSSDALHITRGEEQTLIRVPPNSKFICGSITDTLGIFTSQAPKFDLIILDPPWPNRSARRRKSYRISNGNEDIKTLLTSIPIRDYLEDNARVGIWITNKKAFRDMVLGTGGLFEQWGVGLVEDWIWLKVTSVGEPFSDLNGRWRKPYEILLVGRKGANSDVDVSDVKRRVLIAVPDLHSRKPNLKEVFERMIEKEKYEALEIFARNLTAGWWAWGDEAVKFQREECWIEEH